MLTKDDKEALIIRLRMILGSIEADTNTAEDEIRNLIKEVEKDGMIVPF